ncbi:MAG: hypothetical protein P0116_01375 [Candidatus Nitrosocosmicus sp.]|nr:hypothetical protein [Candidatus Nitrosocosmicus sp.]
MITLEAIVLFLTYVLDIVAISIILITMGQLILLLLRRALVVDSKKFPASKSFFHVFMKQVNVISNESTSEPKIFIIPILANGLLFALEFECANAVLRLILVISSLFRDGPNPDIYNTIIFFVGIFAIRMITSFTLKKFDL